MSNYANSSQSVDFQSIEEGDFVEKRIGFEGNRAIYTGQYQVLNIVFTGTEDVAVIQHIFTKSVECVDVVLLKALPDIPVTISGKTGNVVQFGR